MKIILAIALVSLSASPGAAANGATDPYANLDARAKSEGWTPERLERARQTVDRHLERQKRVAKLALAPSENPYARLEARAKKDGWTPEQLERARQAVDGHLDRELRVKGLAWD